MAIRVTEARKGMVIRYEGELFQIDKYDHNTPGNLRAINYLHLRNLKTGRKKDVRLNSGDSIEPVYMEARKAQYLYRDANGHVFMDNENYDQFHLSDEVLRDALSYIPEGGTVDVVCVDNVPLTVQVPPSVVLEVTECENAVKGDTVSSIQKLAKLQTGLQVKVPLHIKVGEKVKVNTDTGEFTGRANE